MPLQLVKKSKSESKKGKPDVRKRAEGLIAELDRLQSTNENFEVGLLSQHGFVFSNHKYKLENLIGSMEREGMPDGFIMLWHAEDKIHVTMQVLGEDSFDAECRLLESLENFRQKYEFVQPPSDDEDINERFEFSPLCSKCGHVVQSSTKS